MSLTLHRAGLVLCFLGGLWITVLAWRRGILWGLGCLFIPVIQLIYAALNRRETKSAFFSSWPVLLCLFFCCNLELPSVGGDSIDKRPPQKLCRQGWEESAETG
jgi:drug/metabolite transporter (DMT)-like permease